MRCAPRPRRRSDRAELATEWAGATPLVFGSDLNLRPRETSVYEALERHFELTGPTAPDALDHLLVVGLAIVNPPAAWPPERREVRLRRLAVRLSDQHARRSGVRVNAGCSRCSSGSRRRAGSR